MTESSGRQRGVDVVSATPFGSCARRGNNCQVFPDKLLRECEAALAIGRRSSGIEKKAQQEKFPDNGLRTFCRNLSGTDFARRLAVLSKWVARLRDDGDGMQSANRLDKADRKKQDLCESHRWHLFMNESLLSTMGEENGLYRISLKN